MVTFNNKQYLHLVVIKV